jgi:hypothetical protein
VTCPVDRLPLSQRLADDVTKNPTSELVRRHGNGGARLVPARSNAQPRPQKSQRVAHQKARPVGVFDCKNFCCYPHSQTPIRNRRSFVRIRQKESHDKFAYINKRNLIRPFTLVA